MRGGSIEENDGRGNDIKDDEWRILKRMRGGYWRGMRGGYWRGPGEDIEYLQIYIEHKYRFLSTIHILNKTH